MPKKKYDLNDNGKIDPDEREIMLEDRRRIMIDADAKRDAESSIVVQEFPVLDDRGINGVSSEVERIEGNFNVVLVAHLLLCLG